MLNSSSEVNKLRNKYQRVQFKLQFLKDNVHSTTTTQQIIIYARKNNRKIRKNII